MEYKDFPVFEMLNRTQLSNFLSACNEVTIPSGTTFIEQGARGDRMYFVTEGELQVFLREAGAGDREIVVIPAPAVIGEIEALTGETRAASVRAKADVKALELDFETLHGRLLDGDPATLKVFFHIARVVARRLAAMNTKFAELSRAVPSKTRSDLFAFQQKLVSEWTV